MPASGLESPSPCLSCGACCMTYRVSFYWAEADARGLPRPAPCREVQIGDDKCLRARIHHGLPPLLPQQ